MIPTLIELMRAEAAHYEEGPEQVFGLWRGYQIWAELEPMGDWYIRVNHPDGGYLYDGYWAESKGRDGADAIAEAFAGAELLESE